MKKKKNKVKSKKKNKKEFILKIRGQKRKKNTLRLTLI